MKPPVRLLDDPGLSAQLRADLELSVHTPVAYDLAAGEARLLGELGLPPAASQLAHDAPSAASSGPSGAAKLASAGQAKLALWIVKAALIVLAGAAVGGAVLGWRRELRAPAPSARSAPAHEQRELPLPPARAAEPPRAPAASAQPLPSASRREIAQLLRIKQLLEHDPAAAYRLAQASRREFPRGALREEREGLAVLALWRSGAHQRARAEASQFLARYPESPLRERLAQLLAGAGPR